MKTFMLNKKKEKKKKRIYIYIHVKSFARMESACVFSFGVFVFEQKHFKYQAIEFATAFLEDFKVFN